MSTALINGVSIETYGAKLLDYSIGAVKITGSYLEPQSSMIPVKLNETLGTRKVNLTLEFSGASIGAAVLSISSMAALLVKKNEITLPDGFIYTCVLGNSSEPEFLGDTYYKVQFVLVGYRHGAQQEVSFTGSTKTINVDGNCNTPAIVTITGASGTITVMGITVRNITGKVVIDGYEKTVKETVNNIVSNKFADCDMNKFPFLYAGSNTVTKTGTATIKIAYKPIYL